MSFGSHDKPHVSQMKVPTQEKPWLKPQNWHKSPRNHEKLVLTKSETCAKLLQKSDLSVRHPQCKPYQSTPSLLLFHHLPVHTHPRQDKSPFSLLQWASDWRIWWPSTTGGRGKARPDGQGVSGVTWLWLSSTLPQTRRHWVRKGGYITAVLDIM